MAKTLKERLEDEKMALEKAIVLRVKADSFSDLSFVYGRLHELEAILKMVDRGCL